VQALRSLVPIPGFQRDRLRDGRRECPGGCPPPARTRLIGQPPPRTRRPSPAGRDASAPPRSRIGDLTTARRPKRRPTTQRGMIRQRDVRASQPSRCRGSDGPRGAGPHPPRAHAGGCQAHQPRHARSGRGRLSASRWPAGPSPGVTASPDGVHWRACLPG
jgi:hypothetical protein